MVPSITRISRFITATISTTDEVAIYHPQGGAVTVAAGAKVTGDGGIEIKGGTLVLEHSQALGKKTDVRFVKMNNAYGKVQLNADVNQMVHDLYVDGVKQPYGTYGSTSSSAQYKDDTRFAGSGVLNVVGTPGLAIILR